MIKKNKYNVCIIVPKGNLHVKCFAEVALLLKHSCISLGLECGITLNEFEDGCINIVLGGNTLGAETISSSAPYIIYQLEQLSEDEGWYSDEKLQVLSNAKAVWDYSVENIRFLGAHGVNALYLPLGYHKQLEQITLHSERDIDVLFFGSRNDRRKKVLEELHGKGLQVKALFGLYGRQRDAFIARSKINLNIHYYSASIFEAVRISYLLNNRCFVISEESPTCPYNKVPIPCVSYDTLIDTCMSYLADPQKIDYTAKQMNAAFKEYYPMQQLLKKVLDQINQ